MDFKATSDAVSDLYFRYLERSERFPSSAEAWAWFSSEKDKLVTAHGWTVEGYAAAEAADEAAFYERIKHCSDCGALYHEGLDCQGNALPPMEFIHMPDGTEPDDEEP